MPKEPLNPGDKIFAKVKGYPHWPCRINPLPAGVKVPSGKFPIFFYGTHEVYFLPRKEIFPFEKFRTKFGSAKRPAHYNEGLVEIVQRPDTLLYGRDPKAEPFLAQFYKFPRSDGPEGSAVYTPDPPVQVPPDFDHINSLIDGKFGSAASKPAPPNAYVSAQTAPAKTADASANSDSSEDAPLRSLKLKITLGPQKSEGAAVQQATATESQQSKKPKPIKQKSASAKTPEPKKKQQPQQLQNRSLKRKRESSGDNLQKKKKPASNINETKNASVSSVSSSSSSNATDSSSGSNSDSDDESPNVSRAKRAAIVDSDNSENEIIKPSVKSATPVSQQPAESPIVQPSASASPSPSKPDSNRTNSMGRPMRASAQRFDVRRLLKEDKEAASAGTMSSSASSKPSAKVNQSLTIDKHSEDDSSDDEDFNYEAEKAKQSRSKEPPSVQRKPPPTSLASKPTKQPPPPPPPPPQPSLEERKEKLKQEKLEEKIKQKKLEKLRQLELEAKLRMMNSDIKQSLIRGREDFSRCLAVLTEMQSLDIKLMMLAKYPDLTITVRKCRKYKLSEKVRSASQKLFDKFVGLFESASKEDVFRAEVEFLKYREACAHTSDVPLTSIQDLFNNRPIKIQRPLQQQQKQQQQQQQKYSSAAAAAAATSSDHDHEVTSSTQGEASAVASTATAAASAPSRSSALFAAPATESPSTPIVATTAATPSVTVTVSAQPEPDYQHLLELDSLEVLDTYAEADEADDHRDQDDVAMVIDNDNSQPSSNFDSPGNLESRLRDLMGINVVRHRAQWDQPRHRSQQQQQQQQQQRQALSEDDYRIHDMLGI